MGLNNQCGPSTMGHVATPMGALELSMAFSYCSDMEYMFLPSALYHCLNWATKGNSSLVASCALCLGGLRVTPLEPACSLAAVSPLCSLTKGSHSPHSVLPNDCNKAFEHHFLVLKANLAAHDLLLLITLDLFRSILQFEQL